MEERYKDVGGKKLTGLGNGRGKVHGKERILGEETRKVKCTILERKVEEEGHRK